MLTRLPRSTRAVMTLAAVVMLAGASVAEARSGRSGSFGSRGARTWQAPPPTPTAPKAAPIERTTTNPASVNQTRPDVAASAQAARPQSRFGGGFLAGLLGAGLLGALFGAGFFGSLGSLASVLGFLLQIGLIVGGVYLLLRFLRARNAPQPAAAGPGGYARTAHDVPPPASPPTTPAPVGYGLAPASAPVAIGPADYDAFEAALYAVQDAYSREDLPALRDLTTPEVHSYLGEEIAENARKGLVNRVSDVKLLQGDLSEAWREGDAEYATVAMRFGLKDAMVDRATGEVVDGSLDETVEATEFWTFLRERGSTWRLSAIQQG